MPLALGHRIGPYEIVAPLGSGGMGEVYRAKDSKLKREVALKVLPADVANDRERLARFQREAEVLASLNHPHIAHVYGLEGNNPAEAGCSIVMELVEGEDLSQRIARGAIPIDEALPIARQIAEALDAAHEAGIVHRDLKPGNIKVRDDGTVKVLDFGLAKALVPATGNREPGAAFANSPTITSPAMTMRGVILGTAAYMSPEQARGQTVDRRTDVWAFGCVLFEMLSGRAAFPGDTVTDVLGAVVKLEPEWSRLPKSTPPVVQRLLTRCLMKDPRSRLRDIGDARLELSEPSSAQEMTSQAVTRGRFGAIGPVSLTIIAVALSWLALQQFRETPSSPPSQLRVDLALPGRLGTFELSPAGDRLAFVGSAGGPQQLWVRALDAEQAQPLAGTESAEFPFWSPDGRSLGFFAGAKLKRLDLAGGVPQEVTAATDALGGSWNQDGVILFSKNFGPLFRISANGGEAEAITKLSAGVFSHRFPKFLPDGRHFLFFAAGQNPGIYLGSLDGGEVKRLTTSGSFGTWAPPGLLVYVLQGRLVARALDLTRGELTGAPIPVANSLVSEAGGAIGDAAFSVSTNGRMAYMLADNTDPEPLTWYDRSGRAVGTLHVDAANEMTPEVSPDGLIAAVDRTVQNNRDVFLVDLSRKASSRFTFDAAMDGFPVWSPDGTRVVFESDRKGVFDLYVKPTDGAGGEQVLFESATPKWPMDWSDDGRFVLYYQLGDLLALPMTGDRTPVVIANSTFTENNGQFSPDARWVAYQSNASGIFEIYVQSFPVAGAKWQISNGGGAAPRWRADGRELYYIGPEATLMAASIDASATSFRAGPPAALFATGLSPDGFVKHAYAVARDGRFLMPAAPQGGAFTPLTLLLNWRPPAH